VGKDLNMMRPGPFLLKQIF